MRSDTLPSDNPVLDRFYDRVNLFWLAAFFLVLSICMSPVLLSWMVLIARASIVFARNAWMQLVTFVFSPVHQLTRMAANTWLLFKVSAINFSFNLAAMTGASKHDEFCRKAFEQSRRQPATQVLLCYDTLVKSVTAVAAVRYCLFVIEANQLFVPTGYLIVMGCGTMIQGLLGLRVVAIRLCVADRRQLSSFELNYRDLIMAFNHWRERRFGRLSTHLCSDLILITVLGMAMAPCFAYSLVWPLFYLMVAVQNAYQLFDYFVRDMAVLCNQCWHIVRYKHMWHENMLVPCRSRLSAMARALGAVSVFGLLRASLGYVCLVGYVGLQPWSILRAMGMPLSLLVRYEVFLFFWHMLCLFAPFAIAPMLLMSITMLSERMQDGTMNFFPMLQAMVVRFVSHAQDNPQRQIKIRAILTDLVTAFSFVLVLYTAFPMLPTFSGLRPMNAFIGNMAPLAVPVLTAANAFLSAMFTKTYVDLNMEYFADWLDRRGYPDWVCDWCERGVGLAFVVVNYVHHVALVPRWVGVMFAHCAYFVFHYSGLQFACYVLGLVGHALGLEALWSMLAYAFTHWWLLAPLRYSLAQFLPLLSINALGWFMLTWLSIQAAYRITEAYRQIDWLDLWLEYKPQIDVFSKAFFIASAALLAVTLLIGGVQFGLAVSTGMSWRAAWWSYSMHMASVALVALMVYVYGYLVPDYFRWLHDTAKRNRSAKSGAQVPAPSAPRPTSGFFDHPHPSAPPAPRNLWGFFPSAPPSSTNWGSGYAAVSTTPDQLNGRHGDHDEDALLGRHEARSMRYPGLGDRDEDTLLQHSDNLDSSGIELHARRQGGFGSDVDR